MTLYEALALRPAFDDPEQARLMRQITTADPLRLDKLDPQLSRDLVTVVHKAMARIRVTATRPRQPWRRIWAGFWKTGRSRRGS
jgi:hypothetical protein